MVSAVGAAKPTGRQSFLAVTAGRLTGSQYHAGFVIRLNLLANKTGFPPHELSDIIP
jgi:hypothetical protein